MAVNLSIHLPLRDPCPSWSRRIIAQWRICFVYTIFQVQHSKIGSSTRWKSLNTMWKWFNSQVPHSFQLNGYEQLIYFKIFVFVKPVMRASTLEEKFFLPLLRQNLSFDRQVLLPWPFRLARDLFSNKLVQWGPHLIETDRKISLNTRGKKPFWLWEPSNPVTGYP